MDLSVLTILDVGCWAEISSLVIEPIAVSMVRTRRVVAKNQAVHLDSTLAGLINGGDGVVPSAAWIKVGAPFITRELVEVSVINHCKKTTCKRN